jgi:hypothetical protein
VTTLFLLAVFGLVFFTGLILGAAMRNGREEDVYREGWISGYDARERDRRVIPLARRNGE